MTAWDQGDLLWTMGFPTSTNGICVILVSLMSVYKMYVFFFFFFFFFFWGGVKITASIKTCILPVHTSDSKWRCQSSAAVTRPHGNVQDVGLNPAGARNENQTVGDPPAQKEAQWSGPSVEDWRCKAELDL